jgi:hypothetical protein
MTRAEFAAVMAYLAAGTGKTISDEGMEVYFDLLGDLPLEILQLAAKRALLEGQYPVFPPAGTLRKLAVEVMRPVMSSIEAWGLLLKAIRRFGYEKEHKALASLPEPVAQVAERMGWQCLCDSDAPDVIRAQFCKAFDAQQARDQAMGLLPDRVRLAIAQVAAGFREPKAIGYDDCRRLESRNGANAIRLSSEPCPP